MLLKLGLWDLPSPEICHLVEVEVLHLLPNANAKQLTLGSAILMIV